MKTTLIVFIAFTVSTAWPQEARTGFDLRATISAGLFNSTVATEEPRDGSPWMAGIRAVLYPTLKLNDRWSVSGAIMVHTRPYFAEEFETQGHGLRADVLQGSLNYSRFWKDGSIVLRAGMLSTAFGSFLLRYDDAANPLVDLPQAYGYYYHPINSLGFMGTQADVTFRNLDARLQFVNSSPANRRSIFDRDQYGNWAGGAGYTIRQGLRAGVSFYRGPYLDRHYQYFFPGEAPPRSLPATAFGVDAQWATGHWNIQGEMQRFLMDYRAIPPYHQQLSYLEFRRVLNPRWFIAARSGYATNSAGPGSQAFEGVAGYRPGSHEIVKVGYGVERLSGPGGQLFRTFELQFVTTIHPLSF